MDGGAPVKGVEDAITATADVRKKMEKIVVGWLMMKKVVMREGR